ncbi:MAG TPA: UDP-N-acetylglucosamine 2-epimerase (non-hydrolyzing) [Planctomycetes bacterium]|nr:UDP-N-acetylglucosamine 2-epimerase (non-hydrolyzing) [Planctomycetota bacterium]
MKVLTVVGARPQFVKAAPVGRALREAGHQEHLIHTGQHYDHAMSQVFFDELGIPAPEENLEVGSGSHGKQTAAMLVGLEECMLRLKPDWVLVYGDTNSTIAAALAAAKLRIPLAHVEAGLRSFNRDMPEEHNRVLTDHCADLLLCPTQTAVDQLAREGIPSERVVLTGDPMFDAVLQNRERARERHGGLLEELGVEAGAYAVATIHRPYNTDDPEVLKRIFLALEEVGLPIVLPLHPRTKARLADLQERGELPSFARLRLIDPLPYLALLRLQSDAQRVMTDSGGMQKEAYFLGVPCVTLRPETEWVETVAAGWNVLVGSDPERILAAAREHQPPAERPAVFGEGRASEAIVAALGGRP